MILNIYVILFYQEDKEILKQLLVLIIYIKLI